MRLPSDVPVGKCEGSGRPEVALRDAWSRASGTRKRKGMSTIRWALWFSLLLVMVFAVSIGYHLGIEYAEQFIER